MTTDSTRPKRIRLTDGKIDLAWREGTATGLSDWDTIEQAPPTECPYPEGSRLRTWWQRGYSYSARLLRAIEAERERDEARAELARLRALVATPPKPAVAETVGELGLAARPETTEVDDAD